MATIPPPNDPAAVDDSGDMPRTRMGRAGAVGRMGLAASGQFVLEGALSFLSQHNATKALSQGRRAAAEEIFETLGRMRGVATKVGQLFAYSPTMAADEYVERLLDLSNRLPPMMYGLIKSQVWCELGCYPSQAFAQFEREPLAAASLGQVHRAVTADGTAVAVKVQYPGVADTMRSDLTNARMLMRPLERAFKLANVDETFAEVEERLLEELDYRIEARNAGDFRQAFADDDWIRVPRIFERSTSRVLIMDLIHGASVREYVAEQPSAEARRRSGARVLHFGWVAMFQHQLLHADPNPGNYLFCRDGKVGVLDFGCVKRFRPELVLALRHMVAAARSDRDADLEHALTEAGMLTAHATAAVRRALMAQMHQWLEPFRGRDFDFGDRRFLQGLLDARAQLHRAIRDSPAGFPLPRDWLFYARYQVGTAYMLYRLGAKGNYGPMLERFA